MKTRLFYQGCSFLFGCKYCGYFNRIDVDWKHDGTNAIKESMHILKKNPKEVHCLRCQQKNTGILYNTAPFGSVSDNTAKKMEEYWNGFIQLEKAYKKRYEQQLLAQKEKREREEKRSVRGRKSVDGGSISSSSNRSSKAGGSSQQKGGKSREEKIPTKALSSKLRKLREIRLRRKEEAGKKQKQGKLFG